MRLNKSGLLFLATSILLLASAGAQADDPCQGFKWDITNVLAAYGETSQTVRAAAQGTEISKIPAIAVNRNYDVTLTPQQDIAFHAAPGKLTLDDGSWGGHLRFQVPVAGSYLVALTGTHWLDIIDGSELLQSVNFGGARGCAKPGKVVEFVLPADRELILQLSGGVDSSISVVIAPPGKAAADQP